MYNHALRDARPVSSPHAEGMKKPEKRSDKGVTRATFFRTFSGEKFLFYRYRGSRPEIPEAESL